jgi:hypothetical protein
VPNKPVTLRRWEIAACFVLFVVSLVVAVQLSYRHVDQRIDEAEMRINRNSENIVQAKARAVIATDNARIARSVAAEQQRTIEVLCGEIKAVKEQIVETLRSSSGGSQALVGRIPGYTQADADRAEARLHAALKRFAPRPCPPKSVQ